MAMPRRRAPAARWLAVAVAALLATGCVPQSVTEQGRAVYNLYNLFLYIAAVVFVVVSGLVIWSVVRYRRRGDDLPKQTHGNNRLELTWTLIPTLVVPVGQTIRVKLVSADVVHSFYVPQTLFKRQAIPGTDNEFDLTFEKVGLYHGQCTQFCGLQHPDMVFRVRVVDEGAYQSWLAAATRRGSAGQPGT
jgi:heme/copper-type cytochrome/quinol oxidase subunit 2